MITWRRTDMLSISHKGKKEWQIFREYIYASKKFFLICNSEDSKMTEISINKCWKIYSYSHVTYTVQSVQFSCVPLFATPWTASRQASLSITNSQSLLKLMSFESVLPSNHPLSSSSPPALNLSQPQGLFERVSFSHQVAKVLEFQL